MGFQIPGADWRPMPMEQAEEHFALDDDIDSLVDNWQQEDALVHRGDLVVDGPLAIEGEGCRLYVIDGSLTISGALSFENIDVYDCLHVTGSVTAENMSCLHDALLVVGRSLYVRDLLMTDLKDAASFVVKGSLSAGAWIEAGNRGHIDLASKPKARLLTPNGAVEDYFDKDTDVESAKEAVLAEFLDDGWLRTALIRDAMLAGKPILRVQTRP